MKNPKQIIYLVLALFVLLALPTKSEAKFYIYPRAGAVIPISGGDVAYTIGLAAGYHWTRNFATQLKYERMIGTGNAADGDLVEGEGIYSVQFPLVRPYLSAGVGYLHIDSQVGSSHHAVLPFGGGVTFGPFAFLSIGIGATYRVVIDSQDFIEPHLTLGISF